MIAQTASLFSRGNANAMLEASTETQTAQLIEM